MAGDHKAIIERDTAAVRTAALALGGVRGDCANCGAPLIGPYCAICGQERETHRRSLSALLDDMIGDIANFDSRAVHTAIALLFQPGELSLAFREGRTRRYMPAFRLYLFVSLVFFVVLNWSGIALMQFALVASPVQIVTDAQGNTYFVPKGGKLDKSQAIKIPHWKGLQSGPHYTIGAQIHFFSRVGEFHSLLPPQAQARIESDLKEAEQFTHNQTWFTWLGSRVGTTLEALARDPAALNGPITTWVPRVLFLLLPLFALLLVAFYWRMRKQFYFVDHLIFSLNIHSFGFVLLLAAAGIAQVVNEDAVLWLTLLIAGVYTLLSMKRFYAQSWAWTGIKFAGVSVIYTVFLLFPALAAVVVASALNV